MRKNWRRYAAFCLAGGLIMTQAVGCGAKDETAATTGTPTQTAGENETAEAEMEMESAVGSNMTTTTDADGNLLMTAQLGEGATKSITYLAEDLDSTWDESTATGIALGESGVTVAGDGTRADGSTVIIEQGGTYVVSGKLANGQIRIETDDSAVVRLVLNGVELSNETTAPIYGVEKCKVILTLGAGTTNVISDGSEYQFETEGEDEPDAPIFMKGDLTINGTGKLEVTGNYQSGIRSKGNLIVASGEVMIDAQDDGLKGKDSVVIHDGRLSIKSVADAVKSNNDSDAEKGFVWIDGGEINIAAQDDGIQAETALIVDGGVITISEAQEALAGKTVDLLGGLVKASASDDGINSAASVETEQEKMMDQEGVYTRIAGGEYWINAMADGVDSNGDLYIEGGTLYLSGPTNSGNGIIDYNGTATITGGTVFAAGAAGMMQNFDDSSTQSYLVVYYTELQKAGSTIQLTDASGNELGSYAPEKEYQAAIISSPEITAGSSYHVVTDGNSIDMEVSGTMTIYGTAPAGGMGGGRGGMGGGMGGRGEMNNQGGMNGHGGRSGMTPPADGQMPEVMTRPEGAGGRRGEKRGAETEESTAQ